VESVLKALLPWTKGGGNGPWREGESTGVRMDRTWRGREEGPRKVGALLLGILLLPLLCLPAGDWVLCFHSGRIGVHALEDLAIQPSGGGTGECRHDGMGGEEGGAHTRLLLPAPPRENRPGSSQAPPLHLPVPAGALDWRPSSSSPSWNVLTAGLPPVPQALSGIRSTVLIL